jgi:hypothetical protein
MASMFIPYEPLKNKFHTTIITKSRPIKCVMSGRLKIVSFIVTIKIEAS